MKRFICWMLGHRYRITNDSGQYRKGWQWRREATIECRRCLDTHHLAEWAFARDSGALTYFEDFCE